MEKTSMDRRARKTRAILLENFIKLLKEKNINEISVSEITKMSDISRGTFYLHYKDLFDMLEQVENDLFEDFHQMLTEKEQEAAFTDPYDLLLDVFTYIDEHRDLFLVLLSEHSDRMFLQKMFLRVQSHLKKVWEFRHLDHEYLDYFHAFIMHGLVGLVEFWLNSTQKSPKEIAALARDIIFQGFQNFESVS